MTRLLKILLFLVLLAMAAVIGTYYGSPANAATVDPRAIITINDYRPSEDSTRWHELNFDPKAFGTTGSVSSAGDYYSKDTIDMTGVLGVGHTFDRMSFDFQIRENQCRSANDCARVTLGFGVRQANGDVIEQSFYNSPVGGITPFTSVPLYLKILDYANRNPDGTYKDTPVSIAYITGHVWNFTGPTLKFDYKIVPRFWREPVSSGSMFTQSTIETVLVDEIVPNVAAVPIPAGRYLLGTAVFWIGWFKNHKKKHYKIAGW